MGKYCLLDPRLEFIGNALNAASTSRRYVSVVDTPGVVKNSFHVGFLSICFSNAQVYVFTYMYWFCVVQGDGLGLTFLDSIESVDIILHLLRGFDDDSITHYSETVNPVRDLRIVHNELLMRVIY